MVKLEEVVEAWKKITASEIETKNCSWVVFKHGTMVFIEGVEDIEEKAKELMKTDGPVYAGTPHGDFNVVPSAAAGGWIVTGHCGAMFTYVAPGAVEGPDMMIGLYGRGKRHEDSQHLEIIHVEKSDA